ncbi:MAG TPA: FtsX-like permease family protein [Pirellulales bacterium]
MDLLHLVVRQWRQRKARTALSMLSVAIAVAAVLGTALAQTTVRVGVRNLSKEIGGRPALEVVSLSGGRLNVGDVPNVDGIAGAEGSFPLVTRATLARRQGKRLRCVLLGIPPDSQVAWGALPLASGRACQERNDAVLSAELAASRKIAEGDRLTLLTRRGPRTVTIVGLVPAAVLAEVAPAASMVLPLSTVQEFFGLEGQADRVRIFVDENSDREAVRGAIAARLPENLLVQVPVGKMEQVDSTLKSTELALRFAGTLSLAMAVFIILNTLRMNFSERRRDVAVLRVLGATTRQIVGCHLTEGLSMGLVGSALGIPLGLLLGRGLSLGMQKLVDAHLPPPTAPWSAIAIALALGPLVAAVAALVPAWQSRKVSAREALGDVELRRAERFPLWAVCASTLAICAAIILMLLVVFERLPAQAAIPAGLLMLVAFIALIPVVLVPVVSGAAWLLAPWMRMEGELAAEQLRQRSTRTGLTVGVLVVAISNGLGLGTAIVNNVDDIREWYRRSLAGDVFLIDPTANDRAEASQERTAISAALAAQPNVSHVIEVRILPTRAAGMPGICIVRDFLPDVALPWAVGAGEEKEIRAGLQDGAAVVSSVMARKLHVSKGDTLRMELQGRAFNVKIAGLVGDYMLGGLVTYLDRATAAKIVDLGPAETYMVRATPGTSMESFATGLEPFAAEEGLIVQSLADLRGRLDRLINGIVAGLWLLLAMGFVVGGIAVANTLTMSVLEQTRELGLLRIVGMTRGQTRKLVLCESSLLGILGAATGTLAGIVTAGIIHLCNEPVLGHSVPFTLHAWLLVANVGGCLLMTLLAAWSPGERAARLDLLSAIAYE